MKTYLTFAIGVAAGAGLAVAALRGPVALDATTAAAQAPSKVPGYSNRVVLENDRVRVKEVIFPAGAARTGQHTHELPHVGVILTPGALTFTEDGKTETVTFKGGDVGYRAADVTHDVGNPGTSPMRVIEVEIK